MDGAGGSEGFGEGVVEMAGGSATSIGTSR
jgi:hypothetical protein